jgi:hypothetical protein
MPIEKQTTPETSQSKDISHEALLKIELPENFVYEGKELPLGKIPTTMANSTTLNPLG